MSVIQGKQLQNKIKNSGAKQIGELQLNEGPIPTQKGPIADTIHLVEYKGGPHYILSMKIKWDDDIIYESIYDEGVGEADITLEDIKNMIFRTEGQESQTEGNVIRITSPPTLEEIVNHCLLFREWGT